MRYCRGQVSRSNCGLATEDSWLVAAERGITKHLKNSVRKRMNHADGCLKGESVMMDVSPG